MRLLMLLEQLLGDGDAGEDHDPAEILGSLAQMLEEEPADNLESFLQHQGYNITMSMLAAFPNQVQRVLLAAGQAAGSLLNQSHAMGPQSEQTKLISWPEPILTQLSSLGSRWQVDQNLSLQCMCLLSKALQNPMQRAKLMGLSTAATGRAANANAQSALGSLLKALRVGMPGEKDAENDESAGCKPSLQYLCAASLVLKQLSEDNDNAKALAACSQLVDVDLLGSVLLPMYVHLHPQSGIPGATGVSWNAPKPLSSVNVASAPPFADRPGQQPCCSAAHSLLACMRAIAPVVLCPKALQTLHTQLSTFTKEGMADHSSTDSRSSTGLPGSTRVFLRQAVAAASAVVAASPACTQAVLAWDGQVTGYTQGKRTADPCPPSAALESPTTGAMPVKSSARIKVQQLRDDSQFPASLLGCWVGVISVAASASKAACKELVKCNALDLLQNVCSLFSGDAALVQATEQCLAALALNCQVAADELFDSGDVHALLGLASQTFDCQTTVSAKAHSQGIAAISKLASLADTCSAAQFLHMIRPLGVVGSIQTKLLTKLAAQPQSAANLGASGASQDEEMRAALLQHSSTLYVACIGRARRMADAADGQVSRCGCFKSIHAGHMPLLERAASAWASGARTMSVTPSTRSKQAAVPTDRTSGKPNGISSSRSMTVNRTNTLEHPTTQQSRGKNSAELRAKIMDNIGDGYDSDGIRTRYSSGPAAEVHAARIAWLQRDLHERVTWDQTYDTVNLYLELPPGTRKGDVQVAVTTNRLTVRLSWAGRVLDGPLTRKVKAGEMLWVLDRDSHIGSGSGKQDSGVRLHVALPKAEQHYWRSLFEGGPQRSHVELLQEAVAADEPVVGYDDLDEGARNLIEDFRERQWMVSNGHIDMERSLDDFRVVIGDGML